MLVLTHASLATVDQLFRYKSQGFRLEDFAGYTLDQWGIKAHNRPWIAENGKFAKGQRIIEVGGAYSLLPKYLSDKYELEAWIGDDFGISTGVSLWSRWGDPRELPNKYPSIKYVFENFGGYSESFPSQSFDRIFSVSTLEHIPQQYRLDVFKDMNRCLKPGGIQLHTIDISQTELQICWIYHTNETLGVGYSEIQNWIKIIKESGVNIAASIPRSISLLDRQVLVESPDVVYRFYPPNERPKHYQPGASLLLIMEDIEDVSYFLPELNLREINLVVFPDWSQLEETLFLEMKNLIRTLVNHPDKSYINLLVNSTNISEEDVNLRLSGIVMSLFDEENLDVDAGPEISIVGQLSEIQRSALLNRTQARIILENENQRAIAATGINNIPTCNLSSLSNMRAVQLTTGNWKFQ